MQVQAEGSLTLHPADAARLGLADRDRVHVANTLGAMTTTVTLAERVPKGLALFPEHFDQEARRLLTVSTDPVTQAPYYKLTQVTIERL